MKRLLPITSALAFSFSSMFSMADQTTISAIEDAGRRLDIKTLQALTQCEDMYDAALAQYRIAISHSLRANNDAAKDALNKAMTTLEVLTNKEPTSAETWALLGHVYGTQIGLLPEKGAYYGRKAGRSIAKAKGISPDNPRVNMVAGVNNYFTPTMFGGSKKLAVKALDKAIADYAEDKSSGYHWGLAEAYVWRGVAQMELGETDKALNDWRSAIAIEPDFYWARSLLEKNQ